MIDGQELKDIRFVVVELKLKKAELVTKGLLVGYRPVVDRDLDLVGVNDKYVWVFKAGCVHMFSTDYYAIAAVEVACGKVKEEQAELRSFKEDAGQQTDAKIFINDIMDALKKADMVQYNGLVKHTAYTVPDRFKDLLHDDVKTDTNTSTHTGAHTGARTGTAGYSTAHKPHTGVHRTVGKQWVRKEVSTANMKRTTKYGRVKAMVAMNDKFKLLKENVYVPPRLAKIPDDDLAEKNDTTKSTDTNYNYADCCGY